MKFGTRKKHELLFGSVTIGEPEEEYDEYTFEIGITSPMSSKQCVFQKKVRVKCFEFEMAENIAHQIVFGEYTTYLTNLIRIEETKS